MGAPRKTDKDRKATCAAREPLLYGSWACTQPRAGESDLCADHQRLIAPHQLIRGTFYVARGEDE